MLLANRNGADHKARRRVMLGSAGPVVLVPMLRLGSVLPQPLPAVTEGLKEGLGAL